MDKEKIRDKNNLVYQFYWGNINNPSIIILGKNPSLKKEEDKNGRSDYNDNDRFLDKLTNNLTITNAHERKAQGINTYLFTLEMQQESYVGYWWNRALGKLIRDNNINPDSIGIFNIYGEYTPNLDEMPNNFPCICDRVIGDENAASHIKWLIEKTNATIYIMWEKSKSWWEKVLETDFSREGIIERVKIVNGKHRQNVFLSAAIDLSVLQKNK